MTAILVIDDEPAVCSVIKLLLGKQGLNVVTCPDGQAALKLLPSQHFAAALIDLGLKFVHGCHIVQAVRAAEPTLPIVVMSGVLLGKADDHLPGLPADLAGLHLLPKPFKPQSLVGLVRGIITKPPQAIEPVYVAAVARGGSY
jgi:two-component system, OmpR family, response regulator